MCRMYCRKNFKVGQWLLLSFLILILFGPEVWGQSCTPGSRFIDAASGFPLDSLPFTGPNVQRSLWPDGHTIPDNLNYAEVAYIECGYTTGDATGWGNFYLCAWGCPASPFAVPSYCYQKSVSVDWAWFTHRFCYYGREDSECHDYDCDEISDCVDSDFSPSDKNRGNRPGCGLGNLFAGNPVNVATGKKYEEVLDLTVSGPGIPLEIKRFYNSHYILDGPLGYGWTHTYDLWLDVVQTRVAKRVRIWDSDGRALYFYEVQQSSGEILFGGESGVKDRLKQDISTGEYILRRKERNLTYQFASDGKLIQISDPNGNTLRLTYTGGLLTQVSDNLEKTLSIQYNGDNRISSITDPKGQVTLYEYTSGDLTKVTYPDSNFTTYTYSNHRLTDKRDTNNNLIGHWDYDSSGRVITYYSHLKEGVPQDRIELSYQTGSTFVIRSGGTTTYGTAVIDGIQVTQQVEGCSSCGSGNMQYGYSDRLDLTEVTYINGANEYTTQYVYDDPANSWEQVGDLLQKTEAVGWPEERTTHYFYTHRTDDPFILTQSTETRSSVVDSQHNKVITTIYDSKGNILSREETGYVFINGVPTQKTYRTEYQYNSLGQLIQVNGPRTDVSDITINEYYENTPAQGNNRGQLKAIINALGQRTEFSDYDANGNVGRIVDPNGVVTLRTYDGRNRIKTIKTSFGLPTEALTQYFYDARGNLITVIMPEGNTINSTFDLANRLIEVSDTLGNKIIYGYDVEGNRIREEIKDLQGTLKKYLDFTYDAYNRLKKIINPDTNYTEYTYDGLGNRTNIKDPKNYNTAYTYDALKRVSTMTQPANTITQYGYDPHDNQISITDPKGNTTQYQYDDFGRRNQTISPDTGTTSYLYDEAANIIQKMDARGTVVNYTYDVLNRLADLQFLADPSQNITYTYDSISVSYGIGRLTGRTDSSGTYTFYYDAQGNMVKEEKIISNVRYTTQYTYNKNNIITSVTYPSGRMITYGLDQEGKVNQVSTTLNGNSKTLASGIIYLPYGRITGFTFGNGLSLAQSHDLQYQTSSIVIGPFLNRTYGYDPNGNITLIYDAPEILGDQVLEEAGTYSYQSGTNKLTQVQGESNVVYGYDANGNIVSANNRTYTYNPSNQLISVVEDRATIAEYVYNGLNQRIKKVVQGVTRIFHYDLSGHLIAETNENGQMIAEYVYLGDNPLAMIKPGEAVYYYHNDHLGTPQILTDDSSNIVWKAVYTPFGEAEIAEIKVGSVENPFRFPGQFYDQETGLHYNWHRYYDPKTGRYLTPDPIESGNNFFLYVGNNPINRFDELGLFDDGINDRGGIWHGHSDFYGGYGPNKICDYTLEDKGRTISINPFENWRHFRDQSLVEIDLRKDLANCDKKNFCSHMHQGQDYYTHYDKGYRYIHPIGPFNPDHDEKAWVKAEMWTRLWVQMWQRKCECKY